MASLSQWVAGARPRTLPMAVCPVIIGAAAAFAQSWHTRWYAYAPLADATYSPGPNPVFALVIVVLLALIVALALQVGVNYANDYSDGVRGTDDVRVGPMRVTASGAAAPGQVKAAAFISFGVAAVAGLVIVLMIGAWWLIAVGVVCILAAWWYTGGSKPYGYLGLGEVMVFIFFGLVATLGTAFAVTEVGKVEGYSVEFPLGTALIGAVAHGLIASALLMANNVRDVPTDSQTGKHTLAVRLGDRTARLSYVLMIGIAVLLPLALVPISTWFLLVIPSWMVALSPALTMLNSEHTGLKLIPVLQQTGTLGLAFASSYSAAMLLAG